MQEIEYTNIRF